MKTKDNWGGLVAHVYFIGNRIHGIEVDQDWAPWGYAHAVIAMLVHSQYG
jgi:hypothetical protein